MSGVSIFIRHKALSGQRDAVHAIWDKHLRPAIESNPDHTSYHYGFDQNDPDTICVFQRYVSALAASDFLKSPAYGQYLEAVTPLLSGPPDVHSVHQVWAKS